MPKKGRRVEKEKKAKKKLWLNERETVSYEQQILDNNRQLARLRSRNDHLETELKNLKQQLQQLEEDRADVVAHLKRNLEEKVEESRELNEKVLALEELCKEELAAFKKKEDAMEFEYRTMESNLNAEVKLAAGKLNALEDWRLARLDLMHKFEVQEEQMAEQEKRHKETLYNTEKALVVGKAKMQREMEDRLKELAENFQRATNIRIADATHRAIRENISLNQEMDAMFEACRELEIKNREYKDSERMLRLESDLFETEAKIVLNKCLKQRKLIAELCKNIDNNNSLVAKMQSMKQCLEERDKLLQEYKTICEVNEKKIRSMEQNATEVKYLKQSVLKQVKEKCKKFNELNNILLDIQNCVLEALKLNEESVNDVCSSCYIDVKDKLLKSLQSILEQKNIANICEDFSIKETEDTIYWYDALKPFTEDFPVDTEEKNPLNESVREKEVSKTLITPCQFTSYITSPISSEIESQTEKISIKLEEKPEK